MKYESFFNRFLSNICHKIGVGVGVIEIDHAKEKVRTNGRERLTTWIDAYDELKEERDRRRADLVEAARRLVEIEEAISQVDVEMADKNVVRCPECEGKKGHGVVCLHWTDCPKCEGKGVIINKKGKS